MTNKNKNCGFRTSIGGQALIEGVMMRGLDRCAMAVRLPDGTIDIQNMQPGELYKRNWSWVVNQPPEAQSLLQNA